MKIQSTNHPQTPLERNERARKKTMKNNSGGVRNKEVRRFVAGVEVHWGRAKEKMVYWGVTDEEIVGLGDDRREADWCE